MALPDERYRAVLKTQEFLVELLNTPRIPKKIKDDARWCLRHYPSAWDMKRAAENCPNIFAERMEPLHRIVVQYQQEKEDGE